MYFTALFLKKCKYVYLSQVQDITQHELDFS